jgi:hypothetical protein
MTIRTLAAVAHGDTVILQSERKEITVSPKILGDYSGVYELAPKIQMTITVSGDQLVSRVTGQREVPLFAESETKFFPKVLDAEIEFGRDEKGAVAYLILRQGGRDHKAMRVADAK